jgi:hypothetical protein
MEQLNFLGDEMSKAVVKIEVPGSNKKSVLRELQLMNLHRASLFPDLDGYALSLRLRYDSMKSPEEILTNNLRKLEDNSYPFIP